MLYDIVPIIIIVSSLVAIVFILIRKLPRVSEIDLGKIPKEVQNEVKKNLIEKKIGRKLSDLEQKVKPIGRGMGGVLGKFLSGIKERASELEGKYKEETRKQVKDDPERAGKKVDSLLEEAEDLREEDRLDEAEKKYLEIVGLDSHNIMAYAGLGEIYYKSKEFMGARESMEYVMKLAANGHGEVEGDDFVLLALIYKELGELKKALESIKKASKLEANNPKILDLLCKISIISKNKKEAVEACERLKKVNPDNEKVKEYKLEIKKLDLR